MEYLVKRIKEEYNPSEIHIRIPSPPIQSPCFYGINLKSIDELIVRKFFQDLDHPTKAEIENLATHF
jgi:amidophosphoribosyltransferase